MDQNNIIDWEAIIRKTQEELSAPSKREEKLKRMGQATQQVKRRFNELYSKI